MSNAINGRLIPLGEERRAELARMYLGRVMVNEGEELDFQQYVSPFREGDPLARTVPPGSIVAEGSVLRRWVVSLNSPPGGIGGNVMVQFEIRATFREERPLSPNAQEIYRRLTEDFKQRQVIHDSPKARMQQRKVMMLVVKRVLGELDRNNTPAIEQLLSSPEGLIRCLYDLFVMRNLEDPLIKESHAKALRAMIRVEPLLEEFVAPLWTVVTTPLCAFETR